MGRRRERFLKNRERRKDWKRKKRADGWEGRNTDQAQSLLGGGSPPLELPSLWALPNSIFDGL